MIRIEHPYYLLIAAFLPLTGYIFWRFIKWRKRSLMLWGNNELISQIFPGVSGVRPTIKFFIVIIALVLVILGLINLQTPSPSATESGQGVDIAIALDMSLSMLSEDISPNRLEAARGLAIQLLKQMPNERISLSGFAGEPITLVPLTPDHEAVFMTLNTLSTANVPIQGSDIGAAIQHTIKTLPDNQQHFKAIILISDGEDHEEAIEDAISDAIDNGVIIYTVGVGTTKGAFVPDSSSGRRPIYKADREGNTVVSTLQRQTLEDIAGKTGGIYVELPGKNGQAAGKIAEHLSTIGKNEFSLKILAGYESRFQYFLIPALLLFLLELLISNRKRNTKSL